MGIVCRYQLVWSPSANFPGVVAVMSRPYLRNKHSSSINHRMLTPRVRFLISMNTWKVLFLRFIFMAILISFFTEPPQDWIISFWRFHEFNCNDFLKEFVLSRADRISYLKHFSDIKMSIISENENHMPNAPSAGGSWSLGLSQEGPVEFHTPRSKKPEISGLHRCALGGAFSNTYSLMPTILIIHFISASTLHFSSSSHGCSITHAHLANFQHSFSTALLFHLVKAMSHLLSPLWNVFFS